MFVRRFIFLQKKLLCHCWILSGFCLIPHSWNEGCVAPRSLLLVLLLCCSALGFAAHQVSPQQFCWACICFLGTLLVVQATGKTHTAAMAKYQSLQPQSWEPNIWIAWKVCVLVSLLRRVPSRCFSYCRWGVFAHLHQVDTRHRFTWDVYTRHRFPQDVSSKLLCLPTNIWRSRTCWCFTNELLPLFTHARENMLQDFISELSTSYSNSKKLKSPVPSPVFRRLAEIQHLGGEQAWPLCAVFRWCKSPSSSSQKSVIKHCERKVQDQLHACKTDLLATHLYNLDVVTVPVGCPRANSV